MTNAKKRFKLTGHLKRRLESRIGACLVCHKCEKELKVGDAVLSKNLMRGTTRYYHQTCWEALFIEC